MLTQDTCIGCVGKKSGKIELGKEAELFFGVPDHFTDLLLFSINDDAAPQLLHVFCGGTNFGFLLFMKSYILVVAKTWRFLDSSLLGWLSFLTDCRSNWTNSASLSTRQNVYITAELLPDCAQVRDPTVLGRNLKSSGLQLWSLSRQLRCLTRFQIPSPAAFCCHLCANIGQQDC